uniref:Uncharacterized protein n=1 Tax=viral metagenome TaxID=1070528 RepID=A0A6M3M7E5_9ZZZZ
MVYNKINLLCPTYHRIEKLTRFITSAQKKSAGYISFTFIVNGADNQTELLIKKLCRSWQYDIIYENEEKPNLAKFYNLMKDETKFQEPETVISMLGDDMEFVTQGYDEIILDIINKHDGIGIFYGNDKKNKRRMCTQFFTTREFIDRNLPEPFMNEQFPCDVIDRIWRDVAEALDCYYYMPEIVIIHHHSAKDRDSTWERLRSVFHISKVNERDNYTEIVNEQINRMRRIPVEYEATPKPEIKPKPSFVKDSILFQLRGKYGDIILGSFIANMLIERGYKLTWTTDPFYEELVKLVCARARVITNENGYSTEEMKLKSYGYEYYINAQLGSKEHHDNYINSDMHPAWYVKQLAERTIQRELPENFIDYATLAPLKRLYVNWQRKPLCVISPNTDSVLPALNDNIIKELFDKYHENYNIRILVQNKSEITIKKLEKHYIYDYSFIECIAILLQAELYIGNDSGLAWASLYNYNCKKLIYHRKSRQNKTNLLYSKLDPNAEDIIIDTEHDKRQEIEYKRKRREWLLSIRAAGSVTDSSNIQ